MTRTEIMCSSLPTDRCLTVVVLSKANIHRFSILHWGFYMVFCYHHHHHDAKRSAVASRRCDLPPKRSVLSQLESISHRYSSVPADLMDPCGERSALSTPPVGWWPDTILSFATEDLYIIFILKNTLITTDVRSSFRGQQNVLVNARGSSHILCFFTVMTSLGRSYQYKHTHLFNGHFPSKTGF